MTSFAVHALAVARDALCEGKYREAFAVFCEVGGDAFAYVRPGSRRRPLREWAWFDTDVDEDGVEPPPLLDQRRAVARRWKATDWREWVPRPSSSSLATYDSVYRSLCPAETIAQLSVRTHPLALVGKMAREVAQRAARPNYLLASPVTYERIVHHQGNAGWRRRIAARLAAEVFQQRRR